MKARPSDSGAAEGVWPSSLILEAAPGRGGR